MAGKLNKLSDQLRAAIDGGGMSRYAVCAAIGLDQSVMSRFMAGTSGLSVENIDRLGKLLGLRIVAETKTQSEPKRAKANKGR
jgi:plasmid maintenance system antidote protein VapI